MLFINMSANQYFGIALQNYNIFGKYANVVRKKRIYSLCVTVMARVKVLNSAFIVRVLCVNSACIVRN